MHLFLLCEGCLRAAPAEVSQAVLLCLLMSARYVSGMASLSWSQGVVYLRTGGVLF